MPFIRFPSAVACTLVLISWLVPEPVVAGASNDPDFTLQWGLRNIGQDVDGVTGFFGADGSACDAWAVHPGARPVLVAIVGTGVNPHAEFADRLLEGNVSPLAGGDPYSTLDTGTNGTRAAGIIAAARDNGIGIAGINDRAWILPVRVAQGTSVSAESVADGIRWAADQNADVILILVQLFHFNQTLADALSYATDRGCLLVAGAGHTGDAEIAFPARLDGCIAVAATNNQDAQATFSNRGLRIDCAAPGEKIWSTSASGGYGFESNGSSFSAAAFVAGAASLVRSYAPQLDAQAIRELLTFGSDDLGDPGHDDRFGAGRINVRRVLEAAERPALRFEPTDMPPRTVPPLRTTRWEVRIADVAGTLAPGSPELIYRTAPGPFTAARRLEHLGGDRYAVDLPPVPCETILEYYLLARTSNGAVVYEPPIAPFQLHRVSVSPLVSIFDDDFETDRGWTATTLGVGTSGDWTRVVPVGTFSGATPVQPAFDRSPNAGASCFVTGQHFGGNPGTNDVDGGPLILTSPEIAMGTSDEIEISYSIWFYTASGTPDGLTVEYSYDGGNSWEHLESITVNTDRWEQHAFRIAGKRSQPSSALQVRFSVSDAPSDSLTEAAVDEFRVSAVICSAIPGDANSDGIVNLDDWGVFGRCLAGPATAVSVSCEVLDLDGDGDVDVRDGRSLLNVFARDP